MEYFPDLHRKFSDARFGKYTIYMLFFDLLPMLWEALTSGDVRRAQRIFEFAEWCSKQRTGVIWSAVSVAFYEHLFDRREYWEKVLPYLTADLIYMNWSLWSVRPIFKTESLQTLWDVLAPIGNLPHEWAPVRQTI